MDNSRVHSQQRRTPGLNEAARDSGFLSNELKDARGPILIGVAVVAALGLVAWLSGSQNTAAGPLREPEGGALYERTLGTLSRFCDPKRDLKGIDEFCRQQADFIIRFPQCDAACRALAAPHHSLPTR
jgi:cytochrome b pre-mRNA-processing protein 3